jgi:flagellar hook protein FlgE
MSLYGALIAGVSGLKAQTQNMAMISDNISNVNTFGYKRTTSYFSTLVTASGQTSSYSPGGLTARPRQLVDQQGVLQATQRPTDVSILGNGFFVVKTADNATGEQLYTRAGSFSEDTQGRLVNGAGLFLQGWKLDQAGNVIDVNSIETISVGTQNGVAVDTTNVSVGVNLDATAAPQAVPWTTLTPGTFALANADAMSDPLFSADLRRDIRVYDSLGTSHNLTLSVMKLSTTNDWAFTLSSDAIVPIAGTTETIAWGTMSFNGDGSLGNVTLSDTAAAPAALVPGGDGTLIGGIDIDWTNGASNSQINFNFGAQNFANGFTQYASAYNVQFINQDGAQVGLRTGVAIDPDGFVVASFSNGATQKIWKLPLATFANPNAMLARNGNAFAQTTLSGEYNLREANTSNAGRIEPGALEGSNVDLGEEFTTMITTQRAYSASARTITTADEMLDELLRLKR